MHFVFAFKELSLYLVLVRKSFTLFSPIGVANGPSKTMGLAKISPNFTGLAVSFFSGYVRLAVSIFFKAKKVAK